MSIDLHLQDWLPYIDDAWDLVNEGTHGLIPLMIAVIVSSAVLIALFDYIRGERPE